MTPLDCRTSAIVTIDTIFDSFERLFELSMTAVQEHLGAGRAGRASRPESRLAAAEEQFRTYAYVAPDQANPHDSLGELLSLVGRYEEARAELERALSIRPDFCASYQHLAGIAIFEGKPGEIPPLAARLAAHCPAEMKSGLECEARFFEAFISRDFDAPWREGFAAWHLLFHALWHKRHVEGIPAEGDVFTCLATR